MRHSEAGTDLCPLWMSDHRPWYRSHRRFTRLTNAFNKQAENHAHATSLFFLHYNYCRPHQTLTKAAQGVKTTPAMAAGLTDHVWTVKDIVALMDPTAARIE